MAIASSRRWNVYHGLGLLAAASTPLVLWVLVKRRRKAGLAFRTALIPILRSQVEATEGEGGWQVVEFLPELRPVVLAWESHPAPERPNVWHGPPPHHPQVEVIHVSANDPPYHPSASYDRDTKSSAKYDPHPGRGRSGHATGSESRGSASRNNWDNEAERCSTPRNDARHQPAAFPQAGASAACSAESSSRPPAERSSAPGACSSRGASVSSPPSKVSRLEEAKQLADRLIRIDRGRSQYKWIQAFELEEHFQVKHLESKKRTIALRLHPDKVDDEVAKYCGGHDRVKQAYHFMDEAYKAAKQWLDEKEHNRLPPWERPPWFSSRQAAPKAPAPPSFPKVASAKDSVRSPSSEPDSSERGELLALLQDRRKVEKVVVCFISKQRKEAEALKFNRALIDPAVQAAKPKSAALSGDWRDVGRGLLGHQFPFPWRRMEHEREIALRPKTRWELLTFELNEGRTACVLHRDGKWLSFDRSCPHAGIDLLGGDVEDLSELGAGVVVACPAHTYLFDPIVGTCLWDASRGLPETPPLQTYE
ncbi:ANKRD17, partial [Symbiodinium sp. CCMP2592]